MPIAYNIDDNFEKSIKKNITIIIAIIILIDLCKIIASSYRPDDLIIFASNSIIKEEIIEIPQK